MRKEFKLTEAQYEKLLDASKPTRCMLVGTAMPRTPQQNANDAWGTLGKELGFKAMTVQPIVGKSNHHFTAELVDSPGEKETSESGE